MQIRNQSVVHRSSFKVLLLVILAVCLLSVGCSKQAPPASNTLIGVWQCVDRPWSLKFTEDGQVGWRELGPVAAGTYQWDSQGALQIVLNNGKEYQAGIRIAANQELTWNGADGLQGQFKRVR